MKKKKLPSLVTILILTLVTTIVWVTFDVYRLFNKANDPVVPEAVSAELNPVLDIDTINQIEARIFLDDASIPDQIVEQSLQIEPVLETQESTETATPVP